MIADDGKINVFDMENEEQGNWMILVQRANPGEDHNIVAYQEGEAVYFISCCEIPRGGELKYWPSRDYAMLLGKQGYHAGVGFTNILASSY